MGYKLMTYFIKVSLKEVMDKKIFLLLWTSLIFSGRSISSSAGASVLGEPFCSNEFCITVSNDEITAEPGLCVVIPCSFTTPSYFKPQHLIWFKCESNKICFHSEKIFHTNKNTPPYKSEFMGRVSLLDPDVNHQNCSIRISDLRESDSGFYQLRVNGYSDRASDGFTFNKRTSVNVGGFRQKPTMTLPDLTEGHQTTLTCSAPALCSTSPPGISWMWSGAAEKDPLINRSITAFKNETLTAVTQRHNSTLTFIPTAELHNSNITCRIRFSDNTTTEETVNLHVNYVKITGNADLNENMTLNLTCMTSLSPAEIQWMKFGSKTNQLIRTSVALHNNTAIYLQEDRSTLLIFNVTAEDAGLYICTSKHLNNTIKDEVNVTVMCESITYYCVDFLKNILTLIACC
uniref:Ig-like domain-containing protein n=1 Tax=Oryzias melastigma TaxID=30732 RepID=A0A3B3DBB9_ORYME